MNRGRKEGVLKVKINGARPQSPEVAFSHRAARGGVVMLAIVGSTQFMVQGDPPSVTSKLNAEGKGVRGEATKNKCREPERVAEREGGEEEPIRVETMEFKAESAGGQTPGSKSVPFVQGETVLI